MMSNGLQLLLLMICRVSQWSQAYDYYDDYKNAGGELSTLDAAGMNVCNTTSVTRRVFVTTQVNMTCMVNYEGICFVMFSCTKQRKSMCPKNVTTTQLVTDYYTHCCDGWTKDTNDVCSVPSAVSTTPPLVDLQSSFTTSIAALSSSDVVDSASLPISSSASSTAAIAGTLASIGIVAISFGLIFFLLRLRRIRRSDQNPLKRYLNESGQNLYAELDHSIDENKQKLGIESPQFDRAASLADIVSRSQPTPKSSAKVREIVGLEMSKGKQIGPKGTRDAEISSDSQRTTNKGNYLGTQYLTVPIESVLMQKIKGGEMDHSEIETDWNSLTSEYMAPADEKFENEVQDNLANGQSKTRQMLEENLKNQLAEGRIRMEAAKGKGITSPVVKYMMSPSKNTNNNDLKELQDNLSNRKIKGLDSEVGTSCKEISNTVPEHSQGARKRVAYVKPYALETSVDRPSSPRKPPSSSSEQQNDVYAEISPLESEMAAHTFDNHHTSKTSDGGYDSTDPYASPKDPENNVYTDISDTAENQPDVENLKARKEFTEEYPVFDSPRKEASGRPIIATKPFLRAAVGASKMRDNEDHYEHISAQKRLESYHGYDLICPPVERPLFNEIVTDESSDRHTYANDPDRVLSQVNEKEGDTNYLPMSSGSRKGKRTLADKNQLYENTK